MSMTSRARRRAIRANAHSRKATLLPQRFLQPDHAAFAAHALTKREPVANESMVDGGESGLIIADPADRLVSCSPQGRRLLFLATHPRLGPGSASTLGKKLPPDLAAICERLAAIFKDRPAAQSPVLQRSNVWADSRSARIGWSESSREGGHIGITVVRQEPLRLRLLRGTRDLPLSRRQAEVAVLMAAGFSHAGIARRLGVTRNTVISHSRWIFQSWKCTTAYRCATNS